MLSAISSSSSSAVSNSNETCSAATATATATIVAPGSGSEDSFAGEEGSLSAKRDSSFSESMVLSSTAFKPCLLGVLAGEALALV